MPILILAYVYENNNKLLVNVTGAGPNDLLRKVRTHKIAYRKLY